MQRATGRIALGFFQKCRSGVTFENRPKHFRITEKEIICISSSSRKRFDQMQRLNMLKKKTLGNRREYLYCNKEFLKIEKHAQKSKVVPSGKLWKRFALKWREKDVPSRHSCSVLCAEVRATGKEQKLSPQVTGVIHRKSKTVKTARLELVQQFQKVNIQSQMYYMYHPKP